MWPWKKITRRQSRLIYQTVLPLAIGILFAVVAMVYRPFYKYQWRFSDWLFVPEPPSPNVVLVAVDDKSLATLGKWSEWPRSLHARAIENLHQAGARATGLDILFADSSQDDPVLATAMLEAGDVVLSVVGNQPLPPGQGEVLYQSFLLPVSSLRSASEATGHANVVPDGDGVVRRLPLVATDPSGQSYPALVVATLYTFFGQPLPSEFPVVNGKVRLFDRDIPTDAAGNMRINYTGRPGTFSHISYIDVVQGSFEPNLVKGKIVLIGMMSTAEPDSWVTPLSRGQKMFGVEIHANALDTILRQRFLTEVSPAGNLGITMMLVFLAALFLPRWSLLRGVLLMAGLIALYVIAAGIAASRGQLLWGLLEGLGLVDESTSLVFDRGYMLDVLYPAVAMPLVYGTALLGRVLAEQAEGRHIKQLFGKYVSAEVAGEILNLADARQLKLGGERRELTVLFADMRGFTQLTEQMTPEEIVRVLNGYLSAIIARVMANQGMVNKFAGDNIMGVWNAPHSQSDHAFLAVKASWEAQQAIRELREKNPDLPQVQFGFGINTGEAVAGNMGSEGRMEYTVIGDAVNLASRLCAAAPGDEIWIAPQTYELVKGRIQAEALEPQVFKGKKEPIVAQKVTGLTGSP